MRRAALAAPAILLFLYVSAFADPPVVTVGIVSDGPLARTMLNAEFILAEARNVLGSSLEIKIPDSKRLDGGWTRSGIRTALDCQLADPQVDVVVTLGLVSCYEAAHREPLAKPVIAPIVIDPALQIFLPALYAAWFRVREPTAATAVGK
jgi:hypothetical protein